MNIQEKINGLNDEINNAEAKLIGLQKELNSLNVRAEIEFKIACQHGVIDKPFDDLYDDVSDFIGSQKEVDLTKRKREDLINLSAVLRALSNQYESEILDNQFN